ncbi:MAG: UDP-N-acetylmuramate--L-alanine ligase [Phycisphaeraceae bacterium]|nr:UDP-N-acetylmuramate--L-alanine ligase [Phycisphaeraceae bacterium]
MVSSGIHVKEHTAFDVAGKRVYMVGIGGCGMAGLARMLKARGAVVSGSDLNPSEATDQLEREGIAVGFDQSRSWLPGHEEGGCDLVVASAAIKPDHPQMLEAERRGIPTMWYAEALGRCMLGRTAISVAGTHGKSTTTAMLGAVLVDAGLDPTVIVGATCAQLEHGCLGPRGKPVGFRLGSESIASGRFKGRPGLLVAESCEFNRSFHNYRPTIASISAVEADHLDVFGSLDEVVKAFHEFAKLIAPEDQGGRLLIAQDNTQRTVVTAGLSCKVETIGFRPDADWVVSFDPESRRATLSYEGKQVVEWMVRLPGVHNAMNGATAAALALMAGADAEAVGVSLSAFRGIDRRTQYLGERRLPGGGSVRVYDDYGHHPTEVWSTLKAMQEFERPRDRGGRLICVFQPHQHSRTRHLLEEFAAAFESADLVLVPHIYFVRDTQAEKQKVSAADLVDRLRQRGVKALHLYPFEAIVDHLEHVCRDGDLVVVMGAGPVNQIAHSYLKMGEAVLAAR